MGKIILFIIVISNGTVEIETAPFFSMTQCETARLGVKTFLQNSVSLSKKRTWKTWCLPTDVE